MRKHMKVPFPRGLHQPITPLYMTTENSYTYSISNRIFQGLVGMLFI